MTVPMLPTAGQPGLPQTPSPAMPAQQLQQLQQLQQQPQPQQAQALAPGMPQPPAGGLPQAMAGGGMNMMDTLRKQIADATLSQPSRGLPLGTAIYVINDILYKVTPLNNVPLDSIQLTCVVPVSDGNGLKVGEQGYAGALAGNKYESAIFRNSKFGGHVRQWLDLVKCFSGMSAEMIKQYQGTQEGVTYLYDLISLYLGYDFNTNQPTQCCLANMNLAEVTTVQTISDKKVNGVKVLDATTQQPIKTTYTNTYFNKHVLLSEIWPLFQGQEDMIYGYFGGQENFLRAWGAQNPPTA